MIRPSLELDARSRRILGERLGAGIVATEPTSWGFVTPTATITLATGERLVVQRRDPVAAARIVAVTPRFVAAGIPVPAIRRWVEAAEAGDVGAWLVFEHADGEPGPTLVGGAAEPSLVDAMGALAAAVRVLDPAGLPLDPTWASPAGLGAADWTRVVSHGDFVPANVLIADAAVRALFDLGDVAPRHPLVDLAWWCLIVRHHHPASQRAIPRFLATATAKSEGSLAGSLGLADVAVVRATQLVVGTRGDRRRHGLALLETARSWAASVPVQSPR